jgi:hypothetical protein
MKKLLLFALGVFLFTGLTQAQTVLFDWETLETSIPAGGSFGNGHFADSLFAVVDNPLPDGVNGSDKVYQWCKANDAVTWGGIWFDVATPLDLTTGMTTFCLDVWMPHDGDFQLKLEQSPDGGPATAITMPYTGNGTWQNICWDFSQPDPAGNLAAGYTFNRFTIFPDRGAVPAEDECHYFDNLSQLGAAEEEPPVLYFDFEGTEPAFNPGGATYNGVVENPMKDAGNGSDWVGKFTTGGNAWDGIIYKFDNALDLREDSIFTMMVYHPELTGSTRLQFDGSGMSSLKLNVDYETPGAWQKITWRIPREYDGKIKQVMLVFAHNRAGAGEEWYFDELSGPDTYPLVGQYLYFDFEGSAETNPVFKETSATFLGVVENPDKSGANASDSVGLTMTSAVDWDGISYEFAQPINLTGDTIFTMMVYHPDSTGSIRMQFDGIGMSSLKINVDYTTPGAWQLLTWPVPSQYDNKINKLLLVFDHNNGQPGGADSGDVEEWYFDELRGAPEYPAPDFRPAKEYYSTLSLRKEWTGFDGATYEGVYENPAPDAVNDGAYAAKFLTRNNGWSGIYYDLPAAIDFTEEQIFQLWVYSDSTGDVRVQLERPGTSTKIRYVKTYGTPGQWAKLEFTPADNTGDPIESDLYTRIVLIFDDKDKDPGEVWYFDNLYGPPIGQVDPYFTYFDYESDELTPNMVAPSWGSVVYAGKTENPSKDDVNPSDNVGLWITGNVNWHYSEWIMDRTIDFSEGTTFSMKVYNADSTGNARIQLDDANGLNLKMSEPYETPGMWQEIIFTPYNIIENSTGEITDDSYYKVKLIFDDADTDIEEYWYFDEMKGPGLTPIYYIDALFTVTSTTTNTDYTIEINNDGNSIQLYDDGTNGDVTAGDNVWSVFIAGLPEGDHVYDIFADGSIIGDGDIPFNLPMTTQTVTINYDHTGVPVVDLYKDMVRIYPNPAMNELNVLLPDGAQHIRVYSFSGKLMWDEKIHTEGIYRYNTRNLIPGVYTVMITGQDGKVEARKFVKQ